MCLRASRHRHTCLELGALGPRSSRSQFSRSPSARPLNGLGPLQDVLVQPTRQTIAGEYAEGDVEHQAFLLIDRGMNLRAIQHRLFPSTKG